ncbi:MAG: bifunctional alpha,alpha-trehalose-phosphate synthase (UDP-forming)/trehalose-phosphatase [Oligoflexus sp.]
MFGDKKMLIVSNRLPISVADDGHGDMKIKLSSGGLVSGLREIHDNSNSQWIGYLGAGQRNKLHNNNQNPFAQDRLVPIDIPKKMYSNYYNGYANGVLWPLFHNFLATMSISDEFWEAYVQVNRIFAEEVLKLADKESFVWVHDYQLMLLPKFLKEQMPSLRIAYFHHIPFPSSEIFRAIPSRQDLIHGLLGADYIGFHTYDYVRHFMQSVQRLVGIQTGVNEVIFEDRPIKVSPHPLGVDFRSIDSVAHNIPVDDSQDGSLASKEIIRFLGIDRLDYTKGLPERLQSFREFLKSYPEFLGKATLIQICVPSRQDIGSYNKIRASVERLVGQINGEFSKPGYTPIQYIFRSQPFEEVVRLYKTSDVCLVTPLRDGLNLVCKEFVAAKEHHDGVLILSEFAGAATEMGEAIQVNPYDVKEVARAMKQALLMSREERRQRMKALRLRLQINDNIAWAKNFVKSWVDHVKESVFDSVYLEKEVQNQLIDQVQDKKRIFVFLDYDGTLTPIVIRPEMATPSKAVDKLFASLGEVDHLKLAIVTGRPRQFCERYLSNYPVNIVSEHGSFVREKDAQEWQQPFQVPTEEFEKFRPEIIKLLTMAVQSVPGSHIEEKETCIVWHYREAEPKFATNQAQTLGESLQQMLAKTSLSVYHGKKSLEIRLTMANKGFGVEYFLEKENWDPEHDALLTIGDDTTDEDMHRIHIKNNISIHIGRPNAYSRYYLASPDELFEFLHRLAQRRMLKKKSSPSEAATITC